MDVDVEHERVPAAVGRACVGAVRGDDVGLGEEKEVSQGLRRTRARGDVALVRAPRVGWGSRGRDDGGACAQRPLIRADRVVRADEYGEVPRRALVLADRRGELGRVETHPPLRRLERQPSRAVPSLVLRHCHVVRPQVQPEGRPDTKFLEVRCDGGPDEGARPVESVVHTGEGRLVFFPEESGDGFREAVAEGHRRPVRLLMPHRDGFREAVAEGHRRPVRLRDICGRRRAPSRKHHRVTRHLRASVRTLGVSRRVERRRLHQGEDLRALRAMRQGSMRAQRPVQRKRVERGVRERIHLIPETSSEWVFCNHHAAGRGVRGHCPLECFDVARAHRAICPLDAPQISRVVRDRARGEIREK